MMKAVMRDEREMKDSGIEWIGKIPKDWSTARLKDVCNIQTGSTPDKKLQEDYYSNEYGVPWIKAENLDMQTPILNTKEYLTDSGVKVGRVFPKNTVYVCCIASIGKVGYSTIPCSCNQQINAMLFNSEYINYKFGYYMSIAQEEEYLIRSSGNVLKILNTQQQSYIPCVVPALSEQDEIVDYLDDRCYKIDAIIAEAKASIEEYKELKQAVIDKYILGFNDIHIKLSRLGTLKNGLNFTHFEENGNIKFLGVGCFKDNTILSTEDSFEDIHIDFEIDDEYLLINGDIIFVRSNGSKELVGRSIMVDNITFPLTYSGFCIRFRNQHKEIVDNTFLLYYFRTSYFKESLLKHSNDSTNINNLNQGMLNAIRISAPIKNEQLMIVGKLEKKLSTMEEVISEKQSLIADLEAYKKSLIYEVVTGKRKVVA